MKKSEIITRLKKYFSIKELVCNDVYKKFGEGAWKYFDSRLLETLLILREDVFKLPITINNGSNFVQRGLRCNLCQLVRDKKTVYLSAHIFGMAVDFDVKGLSAAQARKVIEQNIEKLPHTIRLEKDVNWVHLDVLDDMSGRKLVYF